MRELVLWLASSNAPGSRRFGVPEGTRARMCCAPEKIELGSTPARCSASFSSSLARFFFSRKSVLIDHTIGSSTISSFVKQERAWAWPGCSPLKGLRGGESFGKERDGGSLVTRGKRTLLKLCTERDGSPASPCSPCEGFCPGNWYGYCSSCLMFTASQLVSFS